MPPIFTGRNGSLGRVEVTGMVDVSLLQFSLSWMDFFFLSLPLVPSILYFPLYERKTTTGQPRVLRAKVESGTARNSLFYLSLSQRETRKYTFSFNLQISAVFDFVIHEPSFLPNLLQPLVHIFAYIYIRNTSR